MKTAVNLLAVATLCLAPSLSAAQSVMGIQESDGELSPEVQSYVARGDELTNRLRFDAAAQQYRRAADVARRAGHLASGTTWKAATAFYYDGNLGSAAAVLDQLANEAALVGDLQVEAQAIYYAAWLDGKAGRKVESAARVARLEGLLRSRFMPLAVRDQLTGWLRTSKEVAAN